MNRVCRVVRSKTAYTQHISNFYMSLIKCLTHVVAQPPRYGQTKTYMQRAICNHLQSTMQTRSRLYWCKKVWSLKLVLQSYKPYADPSLTWCCYRRKKTRTDCSILDYRQVWIKLYTTSQSTQKKSINYYNPTTQLSTATMCSVRLINIELIE